MDALPANSLPPSGLVCAGVDAARAALDGVPVPLLRLDAAGQAWANAAARERWGSGCAAVLSQWLQEPSVAQALLRRAACEAELRLPQALGDEPWVLVASQPAPGGGWTLTLQSTSRQRELRQRFDAITRTAGIGHWFLDRATGRVEWSQQLREIFGLAPDEPTPPGDAWVNQFVHEDQRERLRAVGYAWLRGRSQGIDLDLCIRRRDGSLRHLLSLARREQVDGAPRVFGVVIDVSDRRSAEQAMRRATERAALAVRSAGLGTWEHDLRSGVTHWDEQMWLLRGLQPQARALDHAARMACVHPDDRPAMEAISRRQSEQLLPTETAFRVEWPDGQVRWLATRAQPLLDDAGKPVRLIGVNWDITDVRTAEAVRQEREIARGESAAKSQFLARMSHELRTPLNAVLGFTQLLLADEPGGEAAAATRRLRLGHVDGAARHLLALIDDVLDLATLSNGDVRLSLEPVDVQALLGGTLPMLAPLLQQHGVLMLPPDGEGRVLADSTRVRQVLLNLLSNAIKYNRPGGSVRVHLRPDGRQLLLSVEDTGRGMDDDQLRQLFQPFNRLGLASSGIEGTGIGLSISRALAERMGGSLQARSTAGVGSVFELRLPLADAPPAGAGQPTGMPGADAAAAPAGAEGDPPAAATDLAAGPDLPRRHLLYIEDNPVNAMLIGELLGRRADLQLSVATDGLRGVDMARTQLPHLILLDMHLPDIDGLEVLRRLQEDVRTAHIPCVALSANAMPQDIERTLKAGAADYWTKPLDFRAFMAALDSLFAKAGPAELAAESTLTA